MTPLPVLGIVGGIGSGKSFVASQFVKYGAVVIDADRYGHLALLEASIKDQVRANWGDKVFDSHNNVDRKKLGNIVFASPADKNRLEILVFPYIGQAIRDAINEASSRLEVKLAILDAAILLETGWRDFCTAVIFVEASESIRLQRVAKRGWNASELHRREAAQWPLEKKKSQCQYVIPNEGNELLMETLVKDLASRYSRP